LNTPRTGTFFRSNLARESVLDLTLATSSLANRIKDWQTLPDLGSDHYGILFSINGFSRPLVDNPLQQKRFDTSRANWLLFSTTLQSGISSSLVFNSLAFLDLKTLDTALTPSQRNLLDSAALELTTAITQAVSYSILTSKPGAKAKPWWNSNLLELRKTMLREQRKLDVNLDKQPYLQAKNSYFQAIKQAKRDHWNSFLEKEDLKSIFKAMSYTKNSRIEKIPSILGQTTFQEKCQAFRETLFPTPPTALEPN